jgi:hypothetical protein
VLYLSGSLNQTALNRQRPDLGLLMQPGGGAGLGRKTLGWLPWAADNGCFAQGERFDPGNWLEWLASLRRYRERCLFAVLPDVFADPRATRLRSSPYISTVRQLGFAPAYVSQDGEIDWPDDVACLFIGGTDAWKLSEPSYRLALKAKQAGLWVHMGRVNSMQRLRACSVSNRIDSADGTFVRHGPDRRLPEVFDWLDQVNGPQRVLAIA